MSFRALRAYRIAGEAMESASWRDVIEKDEGCLRELLSAQSPRQDSR